MRGLARARETGTASREPGGCQQDGEGGEEAEWSPRGPRLVAACFLTSQQGADTQQTRTHQAHHAGFWSRGEEGKVGSAISGA